MRVTKVSDPMPKYFIPLIVAFVAVVAAAVFLFLQQNKAAENPLLDVLHSDMRVEWGQNFDPSRVVIHHVDVTCDGDKDYVASRIDLDNPDGERFDLIVASAHDGAAVSTPLSLGFDGAGMQYGLCRPDDLSSVQVFYDEWAQSDIDEFVGMQVCNIPIGISDGMCDTPYFFWSLEPRGADQSPWVFFRH